MNLNVIPSWVFKRHILAQSNNGNKRTMCEICSKIKISEQQNFHYNASLFL